MVTAGYPADIAVLMMTISSGPKELMGVSGTVWSVCSFN